MTPLKVAVIGCGFFGSMHAEIYSNMSGVTQSTVNNIISGRNRSATVSTIQKLCDGLGITIEEFFHSELFRNLEQELK